MVETVCKSENINERPDVPVVQPDTKTDNIVLHLLPGEKPNGLFPFLRAINKGAILFIGSASSFFFAGTAEEFFELRERIEDTLKLQWVKTNMQDGKDEPFLPLGKRSISSVYERISDDGIIVLLDGMERGSFWTREEFLEAYGKFLEDPCAHTLKGNRRWSIDIITEISEQRLTT